MTFVAYTLCAQIQRTMLCMKMCHHLVSAVTGVRLHDSEVAFRPLEASNIGAEG